MAFYVKMLERCKKCCGEGFLINLLKPGERVFAQCKDCGGYGYIIASEQEITPPAYSAPGPVGSPGGTMTSPHQGRWYDRHDM